MMIMTMNCLCGMVDQREAFTLFPTETIVRSSPLRISDAPQVGFEPVQNTGSDFVE